MLYGMTDDTLEHDLRRAYGAYEYLCAHDLRDVSATSRVLHEDDPDCARRIVDETRELYGAVEGTHGHGGGRDDIVLEAYQSLYWLMVVAVAAGDDYDDLRPHEPLADPTSVAVTPRSWPLRALGLRDGDDARRRLALRAGFAIVGAACMRAGVPAREPVRRDLDELRAKAYLAPYWRELGE
jgi:phosphoribosyl-ATP pyrophosphohydrolase